MAQTQKTDVQMTTARKGEVIEKFRRHGGDTGSSEVQIAVLTDRIRHLTGHLQKFPKDHATRRGLLQMVGRRAGLLRYMAQTKPDAYRGLIENLGIRR
jgi:small subunit ribosomal protein S15